MNQTVQPEKHGAVVIDLAAISAPARRFFALYDKVAAGTPPARGELDDALRELRTAPRPVGRLGHNIDLVTSGGHGATRGAILDALERLRRVAAVQPSPPPRVPMRARISTRRRQPRNPPPGQDPLPGIFDHLTPGAAG
jgi:hypothetical protein